MNNWEKKIISENGELVSSYKSVFFNHKIPIRFLKTSEEIGPVQKSTISLLIENEMEVMDQVMASVLSYYKSVFMEYRNAWKEAGADKEVLDEVLPKIVDQSKLIKLIKPMEIYIFEDIVMEAGDFGMAFHCEWDIEHGFGIFFENWKASDVGLMEVAFGY